MKQVRMKIFITAIFLIVFYALYAQLTSNAAPDFFRTTRAIPLAELSIPKDIYVTNYGAVINDGRNVINEISEAIAEAKSLAKSDYPVRGACKAKKTNEKPRVIVMTDGEIDDHSSMIRFLLYTCDLDVEAIIETNSIFQRNGHSKEDWYEKQLEAYEEIYPNLIKHNPDYPTPQKLREISYVGDENEAHIKDLWWRNLFEKMIPGAHVIHKPNNWEDTPGSEKIVEVLLRDDPRPVYLQAWGGGNTAARAFYRLRTEFPDQYDEAVSKVTMYNIWYQDGAGTYIEHYHPKVTMIYSAFFKGSWDYNSMPETKNFVEKYVKNDHGPLGALYPQDYISEGDTPAFLYSLPNGLRSHENPTYGGWGGRFETGGPQRAVGLPGSPLFETFRKAFNTFIDADENGDKWLSHRRWIDDANSDFRARLAWCVKFYDEANHHPVISSNIPSKINAKPGEEVILNAKKVTDPDGDKISYTWWHYHFAGDNPYHKKIVIDNKNSKKASVIIPNDALGKDLHIILEVIDNGVPPLKSYHRLIISVRD
jgi:hypothetical protein